MIQHFQSTYLCIVAIILLIMLANKIQVTYPVLLVVAGLLISFIPGIPASHIDPELIFIIWTFLRSRECGLLNRIMIMISGLMKISSESI